MFKETTEQDKKPKEEFIPNSGKIQEEFIPSNTKIQEEFIPEQSKTPGTSESLNS